MGFSAGGERWLGAAPTGPCPQDPRPWAVLLAGLSRAAGGRGEVLAAPRTLYDCDVPGLAGQPAAGEALAAAENGAASNLEKV